MEAKNFQKLKNIKRSFKWLLALVAVFFILLGLASAVFWYTQNKYQDKIYPGVQISNIDVGGKTKQEARSILSKEVAELGKQGIKFQYQDTEISIKPSISSFSPEFAHPAYSYDVEGTVNKAYSVGRKDDWRKNIMTKIDTYRFGRNVSADYDIKEDKIKELLKGEFSQYIESAANASLEAKKVEMNGQTVYEFKIKEEEPGRVLDYDRAVQKMKQRLANINTENKVTLTSIEQYPRIHKEDCAGVVAEVEDLMQNAPWELEHTRGGPEATGTPEVINSWEIDKDRMSSWLSLREKKENIRPTLDREKISAYLEETVSPEVNVEPVNAKFEMKDGRVTEFRESEPGEKVDIEKTVSGLIESFIEERSERGDIFVKKVESEYTNENINDLGVKEKLGTGHSNFAGSPANRVHNIYVGANSLNGLLIEPGEEFSTMQALGEISKATGYKPELVIKDNETVPEYGGGLCQIGTTMFRAALESGLEITERRNHSYRVSYYEPPVGMDATIYDPHPDLRFKNDTEDHILIQSRIEGTDIYFDLWGTDDGREVEITDPIVYNITEPEPPEMVETTELEPGKEKCTEEAHNGANAEFTYRVDYSEEDKEDKERVFYSSYQPWQKKCLIGVEEEEDKENEEENNEKEKDDTEESQESDQGSDNER
jgi:vancomycin resistance protein YoaR